MCNTHVLLCLIFFCAGFPFSTSDKSLPELPLVGPRVWKIKKNPTDWTIVSLVLCQDQPSFVKGSAVCSGPWSGWRFTPVILVLDETQIQKTQTSPSRSRWKVVSQKKSQNWQRIHSRFSLRARNAPQIPRLVSLSCSTKQKTFGENIWWCRSQPWCSKPLE